MHRFGNAIKAGVEINAAADEVGIVANWRALSETASRPAVIFGTSSDRIGTPAGQSYYATVSKSLGRVAPYAGLSYSGHDDRLRVPFGLNVALGPQWSAMVMNDGVHTHLSTTYAWQRYSVTILAVERRDLGLTVGVAF
jgi:hypothetical protein